MENDRGAALGARHRLNGEVSVGAGLPADGRLRRYSRLSREHLDAIGHDEGRVEAHAKLADELRILLLVPREGTEELGGSRARNGPEVGDGLLARQSDAVVADGDRTSGTVGLDGDLQLRLAFQQG